MNESNFCFSKESLNLVPRDAFENYNMQKKINLKTYKKHTKNIEKCILCLLINAFFVFAIFIAFLIGHWASSDYYNKNIINSSKKLKKLSITDSNTIYNIHSPNFENYLEFSNYLKTKYYHIPPAFTSISFLDNFDVSSLIKPLHYNIDLDFTEITSNEHIHGNVSILFQYKGNSSSNKLGFQAGKNIFIKRIQLLSNKARNSIIIKSIKRNLHNNFVSLFLKQHLKQNNEYKIKIEFWTKICQTNFEGTFCLRSTVINKNNIVNLNKSKIFTMVTKFEPKFAHTFLPCWDEPSIKTTFNVSILHAKKYNMVLSNMPVIFQKNEPNLLYYNNKYNHLKNINFVRTHFMITPHMSIYLLAFAIGIFKPLELKSKVTSMPINIWIEPENILAARFAANFAPYIFEKIQKKFEVKYPLKKLDFVIIPKFTAIGVENWGLIVCDAKYFFSSSTKSFKKFSKLSTTNQNINYPLVPNNNIAIDQKFEEYQIKKIITHEIIHQWFGGLVTMSNWKNLWLKEGFTTYFVYNLLSNTDPFLTEYEYYQNLINLLRKQSYDLTGPLVYRNNINEKKYIEIHDYFDYFNHYIKGSVIIKLIKDLIGKHNFHLFIIKYLKKYAYKSVNEKSLWACLPMYVQHGAKHQKLSKIINSWLYNDGLPELIIKNYNNQLVQIKQQKTIENQFTTYLPVDFFDNSQKQLSNFTSLKINESKKSIHSKRNSKKIFIKQTKKNWLIPFTYLFGSTRSHTGQTMRQFWIKKQIIRFVDISLQSKQYILANPHWIYPYKINYDLNNWKLLINQLHFNYLEIPKMSRLQLLVDSQTYLKQSEPHFYVYLLSYLKKETELGILLFGLDAVYDLIDLFSGTKIINTLLIKLLPVIQQIDCQINITSVKTNSNLSALWLLNPLRLIKLYQLQCFSNLVSCDENQQITKWLAFPTLLDAENYQQIIAICHYLFTKSSKLEISLLNKLLKKKSKKWHLLVQLVSCVRDEKLISTTIEQVIRTKNAAIYLGVLKGAYLVQYNEKFRQLFWHGIAQLPLYERQLLFSIDTKKSNRLGQYFFHSARTLDELNLIELLLPYWPNLFRIHINYLKKKLSWLHTHATNQLFKFIANV